MSMQFTYGPPPILVRLETALQEAGSLVHHQANSLSSIPTTKSRGAMATNLTRQHPQLDTAAEAQIRCGELRTAAS